tara:strand:- start:28100 stop:28459 length:360 start_codon:yes stop_codon:yes gene_type:complete
MDKLSKKWRGIMHLNIMRQTTTETHRIAGVLQVLLYLEGRHRKIRAAKVIDFTPHSTTIKREATSALKILKRVYKVLTEEVLLQPEKWSRNKYKEVEFYAADVIGYLIETTETKLNECP